MQYFAFRTVHITIYNCKFETSHTRFEKLYRFKCGMSRFRFQLNAQQNA